jgi:hypothetical protein
MLEGLAAQFVVALASVDERDQRPCVGQGRDFEVLAERRLSSSR